MSCRIRATRRPCIGSALKEERWVYVVPGGGFAFAGNRAGGDLFRTGRDAHATIRSMMQRSPFADIEFDIVEEAWTYAEPDARWTRMYRDGALFVGGPLDGKRMAIESIGDRYYVQVPRPIYCPTASVMPLPSDIVPIDTAVYMRMEAGASVDQYQKYQHVIYVFAGIQSTRYPQVGENVVFRGVAYTIATRHYDGRVTVAAKARSVSILVAEKDMYYYWPTEMWAIRDGASVEVRTKSQETAP